MVAIGMIWRDVRDRFRAAGIDTAELDARLLAQQAFGFEPMALVRREREEAADDPLKLLDQFAQRRLAGEPVSRIIGEREFWGLRFELGNATLDPRPETELLVQEAIAFLEEKKQPVFVDLGTGSGAIAIALADALPKARGTATDIAPEALVVAKANAQRHGVADRLAFKQGAWWQAVPHTGIFDLIVSNPPYIPTAEIETLSIEVRVFDPKLALDGGWDGLEAYRAIGSQAVRRLNPGGRLMLEIGYNQAEVVGKIMSRAGFGRIETLRDLQGLDRVVICSHS